MMMHSNHSQSSHSITTAGYTQSLGRKNKQRAIVNENEKTPPVLVIQATSRYEAKDATQFSFEIGDFFHVTEVRMEKNGSTWFQVENPAKSLAQGLVPSTHFRKFGPTRPANLVPIDQLSINPPKEPQSLIEFPKTEVPSLSTSPISTYPKNPAISRPFHDVRSRSVNLGCGSLFGIVKYSFLAERPDEMNAQCGEPVIIVAHSAQEWFVVKPICRLGAPGLIPASYLEIQEIQTCRVLSSEQVSRLMQTSAIPTVDEWKKMIADHRARCISLGVITNENAPINPATAVAQSTRSLREEKTIPAFPIEQNLCTTDWRQRQETFIQSAQQDNGLSRVEEEDENDIDTQYQVMNDSGILWKADIISFHYEQGQFWYEVQAQLRNSNGVHHAQTLVLYRLDTHFTKLESALQKEFISENYVLPRLPSSAPTTNEIACAHRMEQLRAYLEEICALPESICMSEAVREFLSSRPGDMEMETSNEEKEIPPKKTNSQLPILQLPLESHESYENMNAIEQSFRNSQKTAKSLLSDDVHSWITSWQATTADECRFSNGTLSPSTRPSSINSRSPSPIIENNELRGSCSKLDSDHSLWRANFNQSHSEGSVLEAQ